MDTIAAAEHTFSWHREYRDVQLFLHSQTYTRLLDRFKESSMVHYCVFTGWNKSKLHFANGNFNYSQIHVL